MLYYLIQRYKFESNSQRHIEHTLQRNSCIIWYKDTNLKAIHNHRLQCVNAGGVVLSDTKIQIWKQFTTKKLCKLKIFLLYYLIQRYKFESNSQPSVKSSSTISVVLSDTKIQIWKQFTTLPLRGCKQNSCIIWYKDTNLKAIHNRDSRLVSSSSLYYLIQRYKFESNSQLIDKKLQKRIRCIIWYKDTNLKAIHNCRGNGARGEVVVLSDTKIQIWKQFTTHALLQLWR